MRRDEKRCVLFLSVGRHLENEMYVSTREMYISIWRPPDKNNTSHQLKYTSFHLKYTSHPLSGGRQILSDISGGRHLQNEMYILSEKMYISTGEMYLKYTSLHLKYTPFHLKYTSHALSGGRQIYLAAAI